MQRPLTLLPTVAVLALFACKADETTLSTEPLALIPPDLQGLYGRTPADEPGMRVSEAGLQFGEMKLVIHAGKMEGDTVRIERASLVWDGLEPKTCTGTLARQGDRLLLSMHELGPTHQPICDALLEAEWSRWLALDELPAALQGRYNVLSIEPKGLHLELGWFDQRMGTDGVYLLPGSNDVRVDLLVSEAKVAANDSYGNEVEFECSGTVKLEDGWLTTDFWVPKRLVPKFGSAEAEDPELQAILAHHQGVCGDWRGRARKWEINLDHLPKAPISKGPVSLAITPAKVLLQAPALRCEQDLWGTESIPTGPRRFAGERMTLGKAEPTAVSDQCRLNMRIWCERNEGNDIAALDASEAPSDSISECMDELEHNLCPESITVQAISDRRYQFQVEPPSFNQIACVDTTGDFTLQTPSSP